MSEVKYISFNTLSGGQQTLAVQDYEKKAQIEFWNDNDKALSGKIRQNIRGIYYVFTIEYEKCIQQDEYRELFNNIVSDMYNIGDTLDWTSTDPFWTKSERYWYGRRGETITISEGQDFSNSRVVVPTERFKQMIEYSRQIGNFIPDMEFRESTLDVSTGSYVETGYVEPGYVE